MKISCIIPTRDRQKLFLGCIKSLINNTNKVQDLEVMVVCDEDDSSSISYVNEIIKNHKVLDIKLLTRLRTEMINKDYYNYGGEHATGDLLFIMADDLEIVAPNWDLDIAREYESWCVKYPDKIFMVALRDNTPSPSHRIKKPICFPMFTREAMVAQGGWLLLPKIPTWGVDTIMQKIYQAEENGLDRTITLDGRNYINHISHHNHQVEIDSTSERIGRIFNRLKMRPEHNTDIAIATDVPNMILQLKEKIANHYGMTAIELIKHQLELNQPKE